MADAKRTIEILLQFKQQGQQLIAQANDAIKNFGKEAATTGKATSAAAEQANGSWRKMLDTVKSGVGRDSTFKQTLDLLLGGGVAIGVSLVGSALNNMVQKAIQLKAEMKEGSLSGSDFVLRLMEAVPLISEFAQAGEGINDLFTGTKTEAAEAAKEIAKMTEHAKEFANAVRASLEALQNLRKISLAAEVIANSFGDAFGAMVTGTKSVGDAFRAMAAGILEDIAKIFAKQAIVGGMNKLFGGENGGGIYASIGSMFGGMFAGLAEGGVVPGPDLGYDYQPVLARGREVMIRPEVSTRPGMTPFLLGINAGQSPLQALLGTLGGHMPQLQAAPVIAGIQHFAQGGVVAMQQAQNSGASAAMPGAVYPAIVADQATMRKLVGGAPTE